MPVLNLFTLEVFFVIILANIASSQEQGVNRSKCHSLIGVETLKYLSTKRPYSFDNDNDNNDSTATQEFALEGCIPVKLWYYGRHGTRYPGEEDMLAMRHQLPLIHKAFLTSKSNSNSVQQDPDVNMNVGLCQSEYSELASWRPRNLLESEASFLTPSGYAEVRSIAERMVRRFPTLFPPKFTNQSYYFRFTNSERTKSSGMAFADGIFSSNSNPEIWFPKPEKVDPILKFYASCPLWLETVYKRSALAEANEFCRSSFMKSTIEKVSRRLFLQRDLSVEELTLIYTTCAFETAWDWDSRGQGKISPWCHLFDKEDLQVMAYREDLEYFYQDGYGNEVNYLQALNPFQNMMSLFLNHVLGSGDGDETPTTTAYFSHSGSMLKMLARLGLFNDADADKDKMFIKASNYLRMKDVYSWRTSEIDMMASNLAFVLYRCEESDEEYQVGFFFQEKPLAFPACGHKAFCPFNELFFNLFPILSGQQFDEICKINRTL